MSLAVLKVRQRPFQICIGLQQTFLGTLGSGLHASSCVVSWNMKTSLLHYQKHQVIPLPNYQWLEA